MFIPIFCLLGSTDTKGNTLGKYAMTLTTYFNCKTYVKKYLWIFFCVFYLIVYNVQIWSQ